MGRHGEGQEGEHAEPHGRDHGGAARPPHRYDPDAGSGPGPGPGPGPGEHRGVLRLWLAWGAAAGAMVAAYFLLPLDSLGPQRPAVSWTLFLAGLALVAALLLRQIRNVLQHRPGSRPGLAISLLMCLSVLVFSAGYFVLAKDAGQFSGLRTRVDALYFTVVTLATVGYGDITPVGQTARLVDILQIVYSFVFLTAAATALSQRLRYQVGGHHRPGPRTPGRGPKP